MGEGVCIEKKEGSNDGSPGYLPEKTSPGPKMKVVSGTKPNEHYSYRGRYRTGTGREKERGKKVGE